MYQLIALNVEARLELTQSTEKYIFFSFLCFCSLSRFFSSFLFFLAYTNTHNFPQWLFSHQRTILIFLETGNYSIIYKAMEGSGGAKKGQSLYFKATSDKRRGTKGISFWPVALQDVVCPFPFP